MKTFNALFIILFLSSYSFGQAPSPLSKQVQEVKAQLKGELTLIENIFSPTKRISIPDDRFINSESIRYFDYNKNVFSQFRDNDDKAIAMRIPYEHKDGSQLVLELVEVSDSYSDFVVTTSSGRSFSGSDLGGIHYRGIVRGKELESLVALSVFEDQLVGIISISGQGTINIGKLGKEKQHIIYNDENIRSTSDEVLCDTPDDGESNADLDEMYGDVLNEESDTPVGCLEVYFEIDHDIYNHLGSNINTTSSFVAGIFNEVATIFMNESITMEISEIFVWDVPDSYSTSTSAGLNQFVANRSVFNGDLAHLLTFKSGDSNPDNTSNAGGRANFFGGVCVTGNSNLSPHSYTRLYPDFVTFPVFSRQVKVITHEIGHNLGSRHTHACVWNENNTAIDGCSGSTEGTCPIPGTIPDNTGTIMSYCDRNAGIDFTLGFGPQPGNLIRNFVSSLTCIDNCTPSTCTLSTNVSTLNLDNSASTYTFSVVSNSSWTAAVNVPWITLNTTSGTGNETVSFSISENVVLSQRSAIITIVCDGPVANVIVYQEPANAPICGQGDSLALLSIYNALDGPNWTNTWDLSLPMYQWHGVVINIESGCVDILNLSNNGLSGNIPPELANLNNLKRLDLSQNQFSGSIPIELGNMASLEQLELDNNQLDGSIPSELTNLFNLTRLNLGVNQLTGEIPSQIGNLTNLTSLYLYKNQLSGAIPTVIGNLTELSSLWFQQNQLNGNIPAEIGNLGKLKQLYLGENNLSGNIPLSLGNLINAVDIRLGPNQLTGTIPAVLGNLNKLRGLTLSDNQLTGSIPPELSNAPILRSMFFHNNQLTGTIPAEFAAATKLQTLWLENNQLSGCFDQDLLILCSQLGYDKISAGNNFDITWDEFCNLGQCTVQGCTNSDSLVLVALYNSTDGPNWATSWNLNLPLTSWDGVVLSSEGCVDELNLTTNGLAGTIPLDIQNLTNLRRLNLSGNQLIGNIPVELGNLLNLESLILSNNQLTGNLPSEFASLSNLQILELENNQLSGCYDQSLLTLCSQLTSESISNGNNFDVPWSFFCSVGQCIEQGCRYTDSLVLVTLYNATDGPNWTNSWDLNQAMNQWNGVVLDTENKCVRALNLNANNLNGSIPSEIGNLEGLEQLSLPNNALTGSIPIEIGGLINLIRLNLHDNELTGTVPPQIGNLSNLEWFQLSNNQLSGSIPNEIGNLNKLTKIWLQRNQLTGTIPIVMTNLNQLDQLYMGTNNLSGSIPQGISGLSNMSDLRIGNNQLTGSIPAELGSLTKLRSLTLSDNQLSGSLPPELINSPVIRSLFLHNNQLSGGIPAEFGNSSTLSTLWLENNQLSACFDQNLSNLCDQLGSDKISAGNNFDSSWADFCATGAGACESLNTVTDFPYFESFENDLGLWTQDSNDQIDWTRFSGSTSSSNTGPSAAADGSFYLYTEASNNFNKVATLISPRFDLSQVIDPVLTFKLHVYGTDLGSLVIDISTDNGETWTNGIGIYLTGWGGINNWLTLPLSTILDSYSSQVVQLRFVGTTGNGFRSDIAIDDIVISSESDSDAEFCPESVTLNVPILVNSNYQAAKSIIANEIVLAGSELNILSGNNIELLSGFEVEQGAVFNGAIGACQ